MVGLLDYSDVHVPVPRAMLTLPDLTSTSCMGPSDRTSHQDTAGPLGTELLYEWPVYGYGIKV